MTVYGWTLAKADFIVCNVEVTGIFPSGYNMAKMQTDDNNDDSN